MQDKRIVMNGNKNLRAAKKNQGKLITYIKANKHIPKIIMKIAIANKIDS